MFWNVIAIICFVYAAFLFFAGFAKLSFMISLAKAKLGQDASDKKAINFMYISGVGLLVLGTVVTILT